MSYDKVVQAQKIIIGTKQTVKALKNGMVKEVLVAEDADPILTKKVVSTAEQLSVLVTYVDSMKSLGRACGIDVAASTVAIIH